MSNLETSLLRAQAREGGEAIRDLSAVLIAFEEAARTVIAAGRPHPSEPAIPPDGEWHSTQSHTCPKCAAWDELKALLEKGEA